MKNKMRAVRLDKNTERILSETSYILGVTKTDVIKESIVEYCSKVTRNKPYAIYLSATAGLKEEELSLKKSPSKEWREDFKRHLREKNWRMK